MKRSRTYQPSETHLALYPSNTTITCRGCGTRFATRPIPLHDEDHPELCLTCNRAGWSRLWNDNKPVNDSITPSTTAKAIVTGQSPNAISYDTDHANLPDSIDAVRYAFNIEESASERPGEKWEN